MYFILSLHLLRSRLALTERGVREVLLNFMHMHVVIAQAFLVASCSAAWLTSATLPSSSCAPAWRYRTIVLQLGAYPEDDDKAGGEDGKGLEDVTDEERSDVEDFRAQMLRQMLGGASSDEDAPNAVDVMLKKAGVPTTTTPLVKRASQLVAGQVLVANPERFCTRNPFSRPVKDLSRFGLQGPIDLNEVSSDFAAQMLPVSDPT